MERFDRLTILVTGLLLLCLEPLAGHAQTPAQPTAPPPSSAAPAGKDAGPTLPPPRTMPRTMPLTNLPTSQTREGQPGQLSAPPLEASDIALPINLATALRLADARPLIVAFAQARAWGAEADLQRAGVLWLPQLNLGGDYVRHDGFGPDFNRGINTAARPLTNNVNFLYMGGGLIQMNQMADIIFQPLSARQTLNSSRWDIQTAKNNALLQTAQAYFNVHRYRGTYAGALDAVERGQRLVKRIEEYSREFVPAAEVNRARRVLADLQQQAVSAREQWRIASADLTQVLRLDPRVIVVPLEHDHLQVTLIDPCRSLDDLIPLGLINRPELASQQALVQAALVRIKQEKLRPLMPSIILNGFQTPAELLQVGAQGFGNGGKLNLWSARDDISPQVMWQADSLGLGNLAMIKMQRAEQSRQIVELFRIQDSVAADITRTQARLQSAAARVLQAERSLSEALTTFDRNYNGMAQFTRPGTNILTQAYRPQEADVALEHVKMSYDAYFQTVAEYNIAQFQMFHALGYPASQLSQGAPPGEVVPTNTARPGYLPEVGVGPPPATR